MSAASSSSSSVPISKLNQNVDSSNPISVIQSKLQLLRTERELTQTAMESLELEKRAIKATLSKVMYELQQAREGLEFKYKELQIYDNAIKEIEYIYGHILFSPEIFNQS